MNPTLTSQAIEDAIKKGRHERSNQFNLFVSMIGKRLLRLLTGSSAPSTAKAAESKTEGAYLRLFKKVA